ncbi:AraC family ligand binding domain-containing protein [Bacillales bacterium AN1005]
MMHRPIGYPTFQCMICFAGSGAFHFENMPYIKMKRGDILFVPGKLAHDYGSSGTEHWLLGFMGIEGSFVESLVNTLQLPMMKPISVNEVKIQQLESDIRELWHVSEPEVNEPYHMASTKIYSMLTYIATTTHSEKPMQNYRSSTSAKEMLRASVQYMEQHYMDDLSLANIADTVGYSKQHFNASSKRYMA